MPPRPSEYEWFSDVEVVAASAKALKIHFPDHEEEEWIPRSQISPDGDVNDQSDKEDEGRIGIAGWICRERGIEGGEE